MYKLWHFPERALICSCCWQKVESAMELLAGNHLLSELSRQCPTDLSHTVLLMGGLMPVWLLLLCRLPLTCLSEIFLSFQKSLSLVFCNSMGEVSGCGPLFFQLGWNTVRSWNGCLRAWKSIESSVYWGEIGNWLAFLGYIKRGLYFDAPTSTLEILIFPQTCFSISLEESLPMIFPESLGCLRCCDGRRSAVTEGPLGKSCWEFQLTRPPMSSQPPLYIVGRCSCLWDGPCHNFLLLLCYGHSFAFNLSCLMGYLKTNIRSHT